MIVRTSIFRPVASAVLVLLVMTTAAMSQTFEELVLKARIELAEKGDATAQAYVGWMYDNGQGVAQDYAEAVKWFRKAAEQGNATGQNNLGVMYGSGKGVGKDVVEAARWYRKAAEQGDASGQDNLGDAYAHGDGVPKDNVEAVKWYRRAAEQGHIAGQYDLGMTYALGQGVPQDYVLAHMWFNLSASRSPDGARGEAARFRDVVARSMSAQQIAEAQQRAREWSDAFEKRKK